MFDAPTVPNKKIDFKKSGRRLFQYLKLAKWLLILIFVFYASSVIIDLLVPSITKDMTNYIVDSFGIDFQFGELMNLALLALTFYIVSSIMFFFGDFTSAVLSQRLVYRLRKDIKNKLDRLPLSYYDKNSKGDILSRVNNDTDTIANTVREGLGQMIWASTSVIAVTCIMFYENWLLTLITLATVPFFFLVAWFFMKRARVLFVRQQKELGLLNGHIEEMYGGHNVVKLYGLEQKSVNKFNEINNRLMTASGSAHGVSGMIMPAMQFIGSVAFIGIAVVGAVLIGGDSGAMFGVPVTLGTIVAFVQYRNKFTQPINQVANIANIIQSTFAAAERVFELLDADEEVPDTAQAVGANDVRPMVEFKNVSFSYDPQKPLIKNLSFSVPAGGNIAIVGPTGAGKTTLVNLLMRFYDIQEGKITIDGKDISEYNRNDLRSLFGMVLQDTWLFSGTIAENIAYGDLSASRERIEEVAKSAHVHHFIGTLEHGYDTVMNEDSSNVSQGQKQLITIARAILKNPKILILDEATSSVDTRTEQHIQTAMTEMMVGRTSFVIAHRLSTIKNASLILVMSNGSVVETGTHTELLKKGGAYSEMYQSQFMNDSE